MVPRRRPEPRLEPLALPLPAGRVPVRGARRRERRARQARPRVRAARHRRLRRRPLLDRRGRLRQGRPRRPADDDPGHERRAGGRRRCTCCRRPGSATRGPGTLDAERPRARAPTDGAVAHRAPVPRRARARSPTPGPDGAPPALLFCDNETNTARLFGVERLARRTRRTGSTTTSSRARRRVNPEQRGTKAAFWYRADGRARARRSSCGSGSGRRPGARTRRGATSTRSSRRGGARPTSSTPS